MLNWLKNLFTRKQQISDSLLKQDTIQVFGNGIKIVTIKRATFQSTSKKEMRDTIWRIIKTFIKNSPLKNKKRIKFKFI